MIENRERRNPPSRDIFLRVGRSKEETGCFCDKKASRETACINMFLVVFEQTQPAINVIQGLWYACLTIANFARSFEVHTVSSFEYARRLKLFGLL